MKRLKLLTALLALTIGLAGCGKGSSASSSSVQPLSSDTHSGSTPRNTPSSSRNCMPKDVRLYLSPITPK